MVKSLKENETVCVFCQVSQAVLTAAFALAIPFVFIALA